VSGGCAVLPGGATATLVKGVLLVITRAGPALDAASTWATGKVFIRHFESGGTFLDFDPGKARAYYAEQFEAVKNVVRGGQEIRLDRSRQTPGRRRSTSPAGFQEHLSLLYWGV